MYYTHQKPGLPEVYLIYSPFHELICSLHVLSNPSHHLARLTWSQKCLEKMSEDDLLCLHFYNHATAVWLGPLSFMVSPEYFNESVTETIARLRSMNITDFYNQFFFEKYDEALIKSNLYTPKSPLLDEASIRILKNPSKEREHFLNFLSTYYYQIFSQDLSFSEPLYLRNLKHQFEVTQDTCIYETIASIHPRIENTEEKINFHKYKLFEVYKKYLKRILIFETSFTMPHLLVGFYPGFITLAYPLYLTQTDETLLPEDTLAILKGLSDGMRLQIIKKIYRGPKSTQALADALNTTEANVSKHLKVLFEAGIVFKERDGNFMNYHLNLCVLDSLVLLLYEMID